MEMNSLIFYVILPICSLIIIPLIRYLYIGMHDFLIKIEARLNNLEIEMQTRLNEEKTKILVQERIDPVKESLDDIKDRIDKLTDYLIKRN